MARATRRVLARSGENALLRGVVPTSPVHVARDVEVLDHQGNVIVEDYVGTFDANDNSLPSDTLVIQAGPHAGNYLLERVLQSTGYSKQHVLRRVFGS